MSAPLLVMLAGPNGAGKSTFFESHLKQLELPFLNADILARETDLDAYEAAGTIAAIRDQLIANKESFITETVFSDPVGEKVEVLAQAAQSGFDVTLIYIGIENSELSKKRVQSRVEAGGHDVPTEKLAARYQRSLENLRRAIERLPRVARVVIYDNSSFANPHQLLVEFQNGKCVRQEVAELPDWLTPFIPG